MWTREELKTSAKAGLKRNYWKSILVAILAGLTLMSVTYNVRSSADDGTLAQLFSGLSAEETLAIMGVLISSTLLVNVICLVLHIGVYNPLRVGIGAYSVDAVEGTAQLPALGKGFGSNYLTSVWTILLRNILIGLWSLLLVVPGIIKGLEYRMVEYIVAENPGISARDALAKSKEMMNGQKWNTFVLDLSFLGWDILNAFTFGLLGLFYVNPYKMLTGAALYKKLKGNA